MKLLFNLVFIIIATSVLSGCNDSISESEYYNRVFGFDNVLEEWDHSKAIVNSISTGGDALPFLQPSYVRSGVWAVEFGGIGNDQESSFTISSTVETDSTISYYYSVSSESHYDCLRFYHNGTRRLNASGRMDWTNMTLSLTPGTHTLTWIYLKDDSFSEGHDTAWIDGITVY